MLYTNYYLTWAMTWRKLLQIHCSLMICSHLLKCGLPWTASLVCNCVSTWLLLVWLSVSFENEIIWMLIIISKRINVKILWTIRFLKMHISNSSFVFCWLYMWKGMSTQDSGGRWFGILVGVKLYLMVASFLRAALLTIV